MSDKLAIVFDGPPANESGRFIEVELNGAGVSFGEWQENGDYWELVFPDRWAALAKAQSERDALEARLSKMDEILSMFQGFSVSELLRVIAKDYDRSDVGNSVKMRRSMWLKDLADKLEALAGEIR